MARLYDLGRRSRRVNEVPKVWVVVYLAGDKRRVVLSRTPDMLAAWRARRRNERVHAIRRVLDEQELQRHLADGAPLS